MTLEQLDEQVARWNALLDIQMQFHALDKDQRFIESLRSKLEMAALARKQLETVNSLWKPKEERHSDICDVKGCGNMDCGAGFVDSETQDSVFVCSFHYGNGPAAKQCSTGNKTVYTPTSCND